LTQEAPIREGSETNQFRRADALIRHPLGPLFENPDGIINLPSGFLGLLSGCLLLSWLRPMAWFRCFLVFAQHDNLDRIANRGIPVAASTLAFAVSAASDAVACPPSAQMAQI